jgi:HAD superfamily hydrolase (TIGR01549 family)
MIKLIVFDLDGTLADAKKIYLKQYKLMLEKYNYKISKNLFKKHFGKKLPLFLKILGVKRIDILKIRKEINKFVIEHYKKIKLIPGASSIQGLKQRKILISNSMSNFARLICKNLKLRFEKIIGGEQFNRKEQEIKKQIELYHVKPKETVYIGDRAEDCDYARKAGCISVLVSNKYSWNSHKKLLEAQPDFLIENLGELKKIL